ncbi:MAG: UDP-galactopyranose mutase, partial [Candidatus Kapabacteria bacterium]|nr:UDP-galactopyranose mutase [Candidatus Kapabacteria bacterium]
MKYDFLIIGAGLSGIILAERIASQLNKTCLIIEKRNHIAGNAYDYFNEDGILVHKYGPHIFHTNMQKVSEYLSQFTDWIPYEHKVLGEIDGKNAPIPFNFNSLYKLFPTEYAKSLEQKLINTYGLGLKIPILKMLENDDKDIKSLADYIYKNVFLNYNLKQWGLRPEELDFSVSSRVPVFLSNDDRYFQDSFQFMPKKGYTAMANNMLENKNIKLMLNTDYKDVIEGLEFDKIIYTGPIDAYFDYKFGELPYRSLKFDFKTLEMEQY